MQNAKSGQSYGRPGISKAGEEHILGVTKGIQNLMGALPQPEVVTMHWGLQIGPYLHELVTDEGLNGHRMNRRLHKDQPEFWQSAAPAPDRVICNTSLTDREIYQHSRVDLDLSHCDS
jgi:hypothetical protein